MSNPAPHSQRKATRTSPLHRQIHSCGHRLWSDMWSNAKNGLVPTPIREGTSPSYLPRKCKLSRAFAGKQKKNGNLTKLLNDEQMEIFEKYQECWSEYMSLAEAAIFEYAFRLGARLALEIQSGTK